MDPQACWEKMLSHIKAKEFDEASYRAEDLLKWLESGGFAPAGFSRPGTAKDVCEAVITLCSHTISEE